MKRNAQLATFLLASLLLTVPTGLWGCDCNSVPICSRVGKAGVIFAGTLVSHTGNEEGHSKVLRFTVDELFKGLKAEVNEVEVIIAGRDGCELALAKGEPYLVFARKSAKGLVAILDCSMPIPIRQAEADVRWLRAWTQGRTPSMVVGQVRTAASALFVRNFEEVPLAESEVVASGEGRVFRVVTDSEGHFTLPVLPGKYDLRAIRVGYKSLQSSYSVTVPRGSCTRFDISMWPSSSISGSVFNSLGQPASGVKLELDALVDGELQLAKETISNEEGRYEFARIPVGDYLLGINLLAGLNSRLPYPVRYFPGVTSRDQAAVLRIDEGQNLDHYDFTLENPQPTRSIRVRVKWPDGRPVTNASVEFHSEAAKGSVFAMDWQSRFTDDVGEARCQVLSSKEFKVSADRLFWIRSSSVIEDRQSVRVPPGDTTVDVELVVSFRNDMSAKEAPINMARFND